MMQGGRPLGPAGAKWRGVLAMLVLRGDPGVLAGDLVDGLWAGDPPPSAADLVQTCISAWRKAVGPGRDARGRAGGWLREDRRKAGLCRDLGVLCVEFGVPACEGEP